MHPELDREAAGDCPECGMALEPTLPSVRARWTCPMHPEIVRDEPGSCPICGMGLEPMEPVEEENPELVDMTRRFCLAIIGPGVRYPQLGNREIVIGFPIIHIIDPE